MSAQAKLKEKAEQAKETVEELHMQGRYRVKLWQFQEFLMQEKGLRTACHTLPFTIILSVGGGVFCRSEVYT